MSDDYFNELLNNVLMKTVPPNNITFHTMDMHSRALCWAHQIRVQFLNEMAPDNTKKRSKHAKREEEFDKILKAMEELNLFKKVP